MLLSMQVKAVPILLLLLVGCASQRARPPTLPAEEVLQRAVIAGQRLESARFRVELDVRFLEPGPLGVLSGHLVLKGILQRGGDVMSAHFSAAAQRKERGVTQPVEASGEVAILSPQEMYGKIDAFSDPSGRLGSALLAPLQGRWWRLPSSPQKEGALRLTPDGQILKTQAKVIRVERDFGIVDADGRSVYRYAVRLDKDKLAAFLHAGEVAFSPQQLAILDATGEIEIDARTFVLTSARWSLRDVPTDWGRANVALVVLLSDQDRAPPIAAPPSAEEFRFPQGDWNTVSSAPLLP